jgi:hypothetical protein
VKVDLHVLRAWMLDKVGGEVDCADIVAVDEGGTLERVVELLEKLAKLGGLGHTIDHNIVLASALERETMGYRFTSQDTRLAPR